MRKVFTALLFLAAGTQMVCGQESRAAVQGDRQQEDTLLTLLRSELKYSMEQLQKQPLPPYFMDFRVSDIHETQVGSSFGAVSNSISMHQRTLTPQVRVGSMALDNFKYETQAGDKNQQGQVVPGIALPMENQYPDGIRQQIWKETLKRYEKACQTYEATRAKAQTEVENEDKAPCFSPAPVERYYEAPLTAAQCHIDIPYWEKRLNEITAVFRACPELETGTATITFDAIRNYLVTTDGTEVVQNRVAARILLSASIKAADGMVLPLHRDYFSYSPKQLPDNAAIIADAKDIVSRLLALKAAPVADPYTGPAIMSGAASGVFFHEIFGHRLEGHRLKTGGQTFKKMVGERVLPETFQVYCDPTLTEYNGAELNGYYLYDDEGVKAQRVNNVENGVLRNFLMSRVPLDGFPQSNGHGRTSMGGDPVSRQSNLIVETTVPYGEDELRKMLIDEARKQGKDYGYYFKTVTSGFTLTGEGGSLNSFNVTPLEVYRVYVDGRPDELVRGVDMIGTPLSMFSNIVAAGNRTSTFTGSCGAESGWVPVTASSPMIFVSKIETQRRNQQRDLPPILPPPTDDHAAVSSADDIIFAALEDEMKRNEESLVFPGQPRPFYFSYIVDRYRQFSVNAVLGGITNSVTTPWMMNGGINIVTGDYQNTSEMAPGMTVQTGFPMEPDYLNIRRGLWTGSDMLYKYSLNTLAQKKAALSANPLPEEDQQLADMQQLPAVTKIEESWNPEAPAHSGLAALVSKVSEVFNRYADLYDSQVTISGSEMNLYRLTSEHVKLKQPHGYVYINISAKVRAADGQELADNYTRYVASIGEIPSEEELIRQATKLADGLMELSKAPLLKETYSGPVAYEGGVVALSVIRNLVAKYLQPKRDYLKQDQTGSQIGRKVMSAKWSLYHHTDMPTWQGQPLMGNYGMDADGVMPEKEMLLVENGILKKLPNGRYPLLKAPVSTGNGRFRDEPDGGVVVSNVPGILHVKGNGGIPQDKMKRNLMQIAKKAGHSFAYIVRMDQGHSLPMLYRVDVKTGAETLVRTARKEETELGSLTQIRLFSNQEQVVNYLLEHTCSSIICPASVLVEEAEIIPAAPKLERSQVIPNPLSR